MAQADIFVQELDRSGVTTHYSSRPTGNRKITKRNSSGKVAKFPGQMWYEAGHVYFPASNERTTLDKCLWSLSLTSWICTRCGRMFCLTCFFDGHKQCCYAVLLLTSAIHPDKLAIMVRDVAKIASELPTEEAHLPLHGSSRELPVVAGALDLDTVWPNSSPIALRGTPGLQLDWSPSGLADAFGDDACIIEDCEVPGQRMKTTIRSFFEGLVTLNSGDETSGSILKLKVGYSDVAFE